MPTCGCSIRKAALQPLKFYYTDTLQFVYPAEKKCLTITIYLLENKWKKATKRSSVIGQITDSNTSISGVGRKA